MNAEILTCNTQFSFVLLCLVWFGLKLMFCLLLFNTVFSRVDFFIIFLFHATKGKRKKESGQLYRCEIFNNLEYLTIKSLNDCMDENFVARPTIDSQKTQRPVANRLRKMSEKRKWTKFGCMKVFSDRRKSCPNIIDTSVFVIGWMFGRLDMDVIYIIQTYAHSNDIVRLQKRSTNLINRLKRYTTAQL